MNIVFLNPEHVKDDTLMNRVIDQANLYASEVSEDLKIKKDFVIQISSDYTNTDELGGVSGQTLSGELLEIFIDLRGEKFDVDFVLNTPLKATICHELNHVLRWQGPGCNRDLIDSTIFEGLATSYEKYKMPLYNIKHGDYSNIEKLLDFYNKRNKDDDPVYDEHLWFFGKDGYPDFLGYKVGCYIVDEAIKNNPEISYADITKMTTEEILRLSKVIV